MMKNLPLGIGGGGAFWVEEEAEKREGWGQSLGSGKRFGGWTQEGEGLGAVLGGRSGSGSGESG